MRLFLITTGAILAALTIFGAAGIVLYSIGKTNDEVIRMERLAAQMQVKEFKSQVVENKYNPGLETKDMTAIGRKAIEALESYTHYDASVEIQEIRTFADRYQIDL